MFKLLLKVVVLLLVVLVALLLGVGYLASDQVDSRIEVTVDAPVGSVFALVVNPTRVPEWLPKGSCDVEKAEIFKAGLAMKAIGGLADALGLGKTGSNDPTHRYVMKGGTGRYLDMQITSLDPNHRYMEKVVGGTSALVDLFKTIEWGYEMEADPGDPGKTKMIVIWKGVAARPLGVFMSKANASAGLPQQNAEEIAANISRVLKQSSPSGGGAPAPAAPKPPR